MDEILILPARSISDYLYVRKLRNQVRFNMTGSQFLITYLNQAMFYFFKPLNMDLYIAYHNKKKAGYLLVRKTNTGNLITEAVDSQFRRLGIASKMIAFAKSNYKTLDAEVFKINLPSIKLHLVNGFFEVSENEKSVWFRYVGDEIIS